MTRLHMTESGVCSVSTVEERGTAVRGWGDKGGEGFVTLDGHPEEWDTNLRRSFEAAIGNTGPGAPDLPDGSFEGPAFEEFETARTRLEPGSYERWLRGLREVLPGFRAWLDAGESLDRLINSNGFGGSSRTSGWQLSLAGACEGRTIRFTTGGAGLDLPDQEELARSVTGSAALTAEGGPAGRPFVLRGRLLAEFLGAAGSCFVAGGGLFGVRDIGSRVGPPGSRVVARASRSPFDGEGVPTRDLVLVEDGLLRELLVDLAASRDLGLPANGAARRDSFRDYPKAAPGALEFTGWGVKDTEFRAAAISDGQVWQGVGEEGARPVALSAAGGLILQLDLRRWLASRGGNPDSNRVYLPLLY
jgi:predicted Zn-dependent protease